MEVFMDDFTAYAESFDPCLENLSKLMCDASNSALGAVLGQRAGANKQVHELLAIVFALDKFRSYLLGSKIIVFFNHVALRFLLKKLDAKLRLIRWMLLLQEFNIEIRNKKGDENSVAGQLLRINTVTPWFANIYNLVFLPEASRLYKEKLKSDAKYYIWDDPYLWRLYNDQVIRRCIPNAEIKSVLQFCRAAFGGGHYGSTRTAQKVLDCGFYWPTIFQDAYQFVSTCEKYQKARMAIISNRYSYILLAVDYVSQWEEAIATKTNDAKVVVDYLKSTIFCRFGVLKALISDQGSHSAIEPCSLYSISTRWYIGLPQHITPRQTAKIKWPILIGRTRADSWRTLYGHTELHTELRWGCLRTRLSLVKTVISWLKSNIKLTGQSSNAIWPTTKTTSKESFSCKNWRNSA
ncbi:Retrovirus-related Pol polyprotein from transposon 17.6, partial [Mucuna pruriens]